MPKYILTVNISSSGIDSCLFDDNLKTVAHVFVPLSNYSDEIHPEDIVTMFIDSIRRLLMKMKSKPGTVSALCISAEPYSYVCVDKNNNPLSLISLWSDSKNFTKNENKIFEGKEEELHKRTGCPISSAFPFKRMYFSKLREYDKFVESYKFLSLKSYLIAILTKQFVEDVATASLSGLFDINDKYWSFDALKILEITEAKLPTVKSPYEIIGWLSPDIAKKCGLGGKVPVVLGMSSIAAVNLASSVSPSEEICIHMDYCTSMQVLSNSLPKIDPALWYSLADEMIYIWGGVTNSGNGIIRHFLKTFFSSGVDPEIFKTEMEKRFSNPSNLSCFPFFHGERTPFWDGFIRGTFIGMDYKSSSFDFMASIFESTAFCIYNIYKLMQSINGRFKKIKFINSSNQWSFFVQFLANIFNRPIEFSDSPSIVCLGSAIAAKVALEENISPSQLIKAAGFKQIKPENSIITSISERYSYWIEELAYQYNYNNYDNNYADTKFVFKNDDYLQPTANFNQPKYATQQLISSVEFKSSKNIQSTNQYSEITQARTIDKKKLSSLKVYKMPNIGPEDGLAMANQMPNMQNNQQMMPPQMPSMTPPRMPSMAPPPQMPRMTPPQMPGTPPPPQMPSMAPPKMPGTPPPPQMPGTPPPPQMPGMAPPSPPQMPSMAPPPPPQMPSMAPPPPPQMPGMAPPPPPQMPSMAPPPPPQMPGMAPPPPPQMPGMAPPPPPQMPSMAPPPPPAMGGGLPPPPPPPPGMGGGLPPPPPPPPGMRR